MITPAQGRRVGARNATTDMGEGRDEYTSTQVHDGNVRVLQRTSWPHASWHLPTTPCSDNSGRTGGEQDDETKTHGTGCRPQHVATRSELSPTIQVSSSGSLRVPQLLSTPLVSAFPPPGSAAPRLGLGHASVHADIRLCRLPASCLRGRQLFQICHATYVQPHSCTTPWQTKP